MAANNGLRSAQRRLELFAINRCASPLICLHHANRLKACPSLSIDTSSFKISSAFSPCRFLASACSAEPSQLRESRLPSDFLSVLKKRHPGLKTSTNQYELDSHGHGESWHPTSPPDAVIYPTSVEEIEDILRLCCREKENEGEALSTVEIVSIIPYGAGTSLEGHLQFLFPPNNNDNNNKEDGDIVEIPSSCFTDQDKKFNSYKKVQIKRKGGISIDMCNFQSIGEVTGDTFVKVGAGVTRNTLNEALRHTGMQFMVDPGADATIGGMTATAASGTAAVKYGTMRENVLAMSAILPPTTVLSANDENNNNTTGTPEEVRLGCNALKSSAGYNLTALLTGSEGTLGILTEITVKLHPIPSHVIAASCAFADLHSAAEAVAMIRMMGIPVSRIELLDEMSIRAFNKSLPSEECSDGHESGGDELHLQPMEVSPTLFIEFAGHSETAALEDLSAAQNICVNEFEGTNFQSASDESTRQALWAARHRLYYSSIALRAGSPQSTVLTDVCVPLSHFADIISATALDVHEMGVIGPCFGHAGDGNFHCILPLLPDDTKEYKDKVFKVVENLTDRAIAVGGTCSGEHGVGYGKKKYLERMYGKGGVSMMKAVKQSLDPFNILNP
eukprot:CAMPEP_0172321924 /NCGR_PEP_ID=MMETSP1058-20130122/44673_1 /TAXON_ID=83371 /ORGANISM="Detonula confervacea, Strain CCMP 353" /LENGTH=617 /DNA_ID=CAMNT_0013037549 /DNA_START=19 /DNA_END=1868 /DNA_ORIENTATION=-